MEIVLLVVLASSIWVFIDAQNYKGQFGVGPDNISPGAWLILSIALWIVFFPMYLFKRGKDPSGTPTTRSTSDQIRGSVKAAVVGEADRWRTTQTSSNADVVPDMLLKLAELRDKGALTEQEFQRKKKELLPQLFPTPTSESKKGPSERNTQAPARPKAPHSKPKATRVCPNGHEVLRSNAEFCPECGAKLADWKKLLGSP